MYNHKKLYLIAEVGGNHNGNFEIAKRAVLEAKKARADCVKFQYYSAENLVHPKMQTMSHVRKNSKEKTQYDRFKRLELTFKNIKELNNICKNNKIEFCLSVFDHNQVNIVKNKLNFFKIASGDNNYIPLLEEIKKTNKHVIMSTGLSDMNLLKNSLKYLNRKKLTLMHCISSYPTPSSEYNLKSIDVMRKMFNVPIALSDHSKSSECAVLSLSMGVRVIEKHFLPDIKETSVGDYDLSLSTNEFYQFRNDLEKSIEIIGKNRKTIFLPEKKFKKTLRRSIYFSNNLKKNNIIKLEDLKFIRPYSIDGFKIENYKKLIGKKLKKSYKKDTLVLKNINVK